MELSFLRGRLIILKQQTEASFQRVMSAVKKIKVQSLQRRLWLFSVVWSGKGSLQR